MGVKRTRYNWDAKLSFGQSGKHLSSHIEKAQEELSSSVNHK